MPKDFLALDTGFPSFTGQETVGQKVDQLYNYTYMLLENLRYCLRNLGPENFNGQALGEITDPIYARIRDAEGNTAQLALTAQALAVRIGDTEGNVSALQQTAQGLTSAVETANGNISALQQTAEGLTSRVQSAEGNVSALQQTAQGLTSAVEAANGNISALQQTADGLTSRVQTAEGNISALQQTADGLTSRVQSTEGNITTLQQTAGSLTSRVQTAEGQVSVVQQTVNGLMIWDPYAGATRINGGMIATNTVIASQIMGSYVYLLDQNRQQVGLIYIAPTSTGQGLSFTAQYGGMQFNAAGNFWFAGQPYSFGTTAMGFHCGGPLFPGGDAVYPLGLSNFRWSAVYAATGTIITSDRDAKHDIDYDMSRYKAMFDRLKPAWCKYNDGTSGRYHVVYVAQDVEEAMTEAGLTSLDFAGLIKSPGVDAEGGPVEGKYDYALRYAEFVPLNTWMIQQLEARVARLEGREA